MSRILVTGGAGFLGSHIADEASRRGFAVRVFDRRESPYLAAGQEMIVGDLLDETAVARAVEGVEAVYHLAALADLNLAGEQPVDTVRVNVLGTVELLEAARRAGVGRFLLASTVYVYSRAGGFYRCSKQAAEAYVEEYRRAFGLRYTILRYGSLYGPRSDESNGVYRLLAQAVREGRIRHRGSAADVREYVHVEDAARLSLDALAAEHADQHLVLTGPHPMRLGDLFTMFSEILGREIEVEYQEPEAPGAGIHYRVTPYAFTPRPGKKLTSVSQVDMGQGILQLLEEMHQGDREGSSPL